MTSVIIPAWNGAAHIAEAILSARAAGAGEIIVVDDASPDISAAIAARLGCRVIRHETNRRQIEAKNTGLRHAAGELIMFLDQDDVLEADALSIMRGEFERFPDLDAVQAQARDFLSPEANPDKMACVKVRARYYGQISGAMLFQRRVFERTGPFALPSGAYTGELVWLFDRFAACGLRCGKIDFVSVRRRIHDANFGMLNRDIEYRDYARVLRERLRKKKAPPDEANGRQDAWDNAEEKGDEGSF